MKRYLFFLLFFMIAAVVQAAPIKIASMHPFLTDMANEIGGKRVKVINLFPEGGALHAFVVGSGEMSSAAGAKLVLLCGKGIEAKSMPVLQDYFPGRGVLVDLGRDVPDVTVTPDSTEIDPHWWNNPENMKIAAATLAEELIRIDPAGKKTYQEGLARYNEMIDKTMARATARLAKLPAHRRLLVTSHPGMAHFCKAFGMTPYPIPSDPDTDVDAIVADLQARGGVVCMFYNVREATPVFDAVAAKLGCPIKPLIMDGIYASMPAYASLFPTNVNVVYKNLRDPESEQAAPVTEEDMRRRFEENRRSRQSGGTPAQ